MFRINIQFFSIYLYIYWNDTLENYNPLFQFMGFSSSEQGEASEN